MFGEPRDHTQVTKQQMWGPTPKCNVLSKLRSQGHLSGDAALAGRPLARRRARGRMARTRAPCVTFVVSPSGNVHEANSRGDADTLGLYLSRLCCVHLRSVYLFADCTHRSHLVTHRPTPPGTQHVGSRQSRGLGAGVRCSRPPPSN